jgi:hypothetical protein
MWRVETADIWGSRYENAIFQSQSAAERRAQTQVVTVFSLNYAGKWRPLQGLIMTDVLFPHVSHGFRGRNFHIVTFNVRILAPENFN